MPAKAKKIISINFVESHPIEARLGEYLRLQRDVAGVEIKDLILAAVGNYYDPLAIAADPNSSPEEIESALIDAVLNLTNQRNRLIAHCERHGVILQSDCKTLLGVGNFSSVHVRPVQNLKTQKKTPIVIKDEEGEEEGYNPQNDVDDDLDLLRKTRSK
jgi:hypothetical protein